MKTKYNSKILIPAVLIVAAIGVVFINSAVSSARLERNNKIFHEMLLEKMPNLVITEELIGRPVIISPGYRLEYYASGRAEPEEAAIGFVAQHEETGIDPVKLYFETIFGKERNSYLFDFPGCQPNECVSRAKDLKAKAVEREEAKHFEAGLNVEDFIILSDTIDGVYYEAELDVHYDSEFRIVKFFVTTARATVNRREKKIADFNSVGPTKRAPRYLFVYVNNLALGVDEQAFEVRGDLSIDLGKGL